MRIERPLRALCAAALAAVLAHGAAAQTEPDAAARIAALRQRLAAVEARSTAADDVNAIETLQGTYGYYTDKMLWDEVVDLFAEQGTLEIGPSGVYVGKDSIRRYLASLSGGREGPVPGVLYEHLQLEPVVTVAPDGASARGRWRGFLMIGTLGDADGGRWGAGVYENEYVKEAGVWKISMLHWVPDFVAPYRHGWLNADKAAVEDYARGRGVAPDRPSTVPFDPYPGTYRAPFHYPNPVTGE
jgi:hypothetical protein